MVGVKVSVLSLLLSLVAIINSEDNNAESTDHHMEMCILKIKT